MPARRAAAGLVPLGLAAALLAACAAPAPRRSPRGEDAEILRRQQRVSAVGEAFPFFWDAEVLAAVGRTGDDIARAAGMAEEGFHYYVLAEPVLNAFTSPTGDIFFFTGQLGAMRSRDELAGVLAHEIAHVRAGHYERIQRSSALGTVPAVAAIILTGGNPAVFAGTLALLESYQLAFSREMEEEADRLSVIYLRSTSYDPRGLVGALGLIERGERLVPTGVPESLRTHPLTASRIGALENAIGLPPGGTWTPPPDPAWERVRAIVAVREDPVRAVREYGERAASGAAPDLALLGLVQLRRGDPAAAADALRRAAAGAPEDAAVAADLGAALWALGDASGATAELERALRLPGGDSSSVAHYLLGELLRAAGREEEARAQYRRAAGLEPALAEAHYQLALSLGPVGQRGEADFHFGRAAELRGDYAGALASYRRARPQLGADPVWAARIGEALRRME